MPIKKVKNTTIQEVTFTEKEIVDFLREKLDLKGEARWGIHKEDHPVTGDPDFYTTISLTFISRLEY